MEEMILPRLALADGAVRNEHGCYLLGFSAVYGLLCDDQGLVIRHSARGHSTKFSSHVGDMVNFTAA